LGVPVGAIFTVGTDEQSFIFVETTYEHLAKREEMLFVIGHECGHIHNHHVTYRTLAYILLEGGKSAALKREHPTMKAVAEALELFHDSELYPEMPGLPRPDRPLLSRGELEGRVGELVALV